ACGQSFVAMAPPAGDRRDAGWIHQRAWLTGRQNLVLAVTIGAYRRAADAVGNRAAVNTGRIDPGDLRVAGAAGGRHVPPVDLGAPVAARLNGVAGVAIETRRRLI